MCDVWPDWVEWTFGLQWFCFTLYPCQLGWLQVDTSVSTRNISGAFCALPVEATPIPTATRDQATPPNYSGEVSITHRISVPAVHSTDGSAGQFVPGTAMEFPSVALSGVDEPLSSVNLSVKNTFSLPDDSLGSSPLSQVHLPVLYSIIYNVQLLLLGPF